MNKWDSLYTIEGSEDQVSATNIAVSMYNNGEGKSVEEIADFLSTETQTFSNRMVQGKLTTEKVYKAPEKAATAPRKATVRKDDLIAAFKRDADFALGTLERGNVPHLVNLAEKMGVTVPDAR